MSPASWLVIGIAVASVPVGWPADAVARRPGRGGGLGWLALPFVLPAIVWSIVGSVGGSDYDAGDLLYFVGYIASVAGIVLGTLLSRALRGARTRRRPRSAHGPAA